MKTDRLAMSGDSFFGKGGGSGNSKKIRLFGILGMGLLISPIL